MTAGRVFTKACLWSSLLYFSRLCPSSPAAKSCQFYFLHPPGIYSSIHTGNALVQAAIFFSLDYYNDGLTGFPSISLATPQFHFLTEASHHLKYKPNHQTFQTYYYL